MIFIEIKVLLYNSIIVIINGIIDEIIITIDLFKIVEIIAPQAIVLINYINIDLFFLFL